MAGVISACPTCGVLLGGAQIYNGYKNGDPFETASGVLTLAGTVAAYPKFSFGNVGRPQFNTNEIAIDLAVLKSMNPVKGKIPTVISVAEGNGALSIGTNGAHFPSLVANDLGAPSVSMTKWPVLQCAEPKALNGLLLQGINKTDISLSTYGIDAGSTYSLKGLRFRGGGTINMNPPCANCSVTTNGTKLTY